MWACMYICMYVCILFKVIRDFLISTCMDNIHIVVENPKVRIIKNMKIELLIDYNMRKNIKNLIHPNSYLV